jgi:hypothetical protein
MPQLLAELQSVAAQRLVILACFDREHLLQHVSGHAISHQRREMSLQPIELWSRPAMWWPIDARFQRGAYDAAKSRQSYRRLAEQRCNLVRSVILHVAATAAGLAGRRLNGMVPGLGGDHLALDGGQQQFRLGQAQAEVGEIAEVTRLRDLHHVRAPTIAVSTRLHQPHDPHHSRHPKSRE